MLNCLAVILFVFSVMSGSFTRTVANPTVFDHSVNAFFGFLSIVLGFFFCVLVMFLWSGGPFELHGYPEHSGLMIAGCVPGFLGLFASTWFHNRKARAAQLRAGA
ncbi:hypothetical protein [Pseudomonas sp. PLMAX]|uniref:hypothetical protein n=1 Tax=Pseudomonas sp. PLMAX TaxID=2201998 RepID=UPI0038B9747D